MKFITPIILSLLLLLGSDATAQLTGTVNGSASNPDGTIPSGATARLFRATDSAMVKAATLSKEGFFSFENIPAGRYFVLVTSATSERRKTEVFEISPVHTAIELPRLSLIPASKELGNVSVVSQRPFIEQRVDRTIVNVDASITNAGSSALEVLENSPGVTVDRDGNIGLKGKEGVLLLIDGRPTQLAGADLANLLRNMNSSQLDQVEIMPNPPARYDAAGTSGIINLKTKKLNTAGYNGIASVGYAQGRYPKINDGLNFNYRRGKLNLFTNLSHNYAKQFGTIEIDRNIFESNSSSIKQIFDQNGKRFSEASSYSGKVGADFFATKSTTLGAVLSVNARDMRSRNVNNTNIFNSVKTLESTTEAIVEQEAVWKSLNANFNLRRAIGKKGRELTADIDYGKYRSRNELVMVNTYEDAAGSIFREADSLKGDLPQNIGMYAGRIDYVHPKKNKLKFETGIKASFVRTDNLANYDSIEDGNNVRDVTRSNHFVYEENINAAYVNLSTPLSKKMTAQFGLRMENTNAKGTQLTTGQAFNRRYTQLFPSLFFQYKADASNSFVANFARRVRRPNYESLNPFIKFIDRYTYSQGNPNLRPSISNSLELSHTWKNKVTTSVNYSFVEGLIESIVQQKGQEAYTMPANLSSLTQFGLSVNAATRIKRWWTSNINVNVFHNRYKALANDAPIDLSATSFVINANQQFKLNKTLTAEISGRFRNGWLEGVMKARPIGFIGAGVSQLVLKEKGTIRLVAKDILYSQKFRGHSRYGNVDFNIRQINDSQIVSIIFSYRFSKGKKLPPVKRSAASSEEEQERIGE